MHRLQHVLQHLNAQQQPQQQEPLHLNSVSATSDFYKIEQLLSEKEKHIQQQIRTLVQQLKQENQMISQVEQQSFPLDSLLPKLREYFPAGTFLNMEHCPNWNILGTGIALAELAKFDASIATFCMVHGNIATASIALCGSEQQIKEYIKDCVEYKKICSFALTEFDVGSDASHIETTATPTADGYILNGKKRWIGNAPDADVLIIWAKNTETKQINGFLVEPKLIKNKNQLQIETITNKIALRSVQNANIFMNQLWIPKDKKLANANDFQSGPHKILFISRILTSFIALGIAQGAYETALAYAKERKQFGKPIGGFQLIQSKLVTCLGHLQSMGLMCWRGAKLLESKQCTNGMSSLCKGYVTKLGREVVSNCREILGGNGIVRDFQVATHFCDMEAIYTYEGTYQINELVVGREITGVSAIK